MNMNNQILQKTTHMLVAGTLLIIGTLAYGQHPGPQPIDGTPDQPGLDWTLRMTDDGMTSIYQTGTSVFPEASEPFKTSSPSNLLPTLYVPMIDAGGDEIPNTLPSTPEHPYNLHPDPIVSEIDPRSPRWDLGIIINQLQAAVYPDDLEATNQTFFANGEGVPADPRRRRIDRVGAAAGNLPPLTDQIDYAQVDFAIDILEGNPIDRTYSGMALLNYKGPSMIKTVDPDTNMVTVHQSWQHSRIMSDAMFIDPSTIPDDEPWTVRYVVDNLFWGEDDFAPFAVYFDDPDDLNGMIRPHIAMDQSFFTMLPGHRYVFDIAMAPHRYYNLTYNWGWRNHPPRIQAVEKATKQVAGKNIVQWERDIFGDDPTKNKITKLRAISMLSDLAPAKRMWYAFQALKVAEQPSVPNWILQLLVDEAAASYDDWTHRQRLPRGIHQAEGDFDQTIVYLNNIMYGGMHAVKTRAQQSWREWQTRGAVLK
ncbi:MAG: hypothetical protein PF483_05240, partial [Halothiobacillus sp.]|nr:hypothetical protein [Halothiobacillus sp.]